MLIKDVKTIIESKVAGTRPMPEDLQLSFDVYEAMVYVASNTTPRVLLKDNVADIDEPVLRLIEGCSFIRNPDRPIFDVANPDYSELRHLNIDEDLVFAVIYYSLHVIFKGNEPTQVGGYKKTSKDMCDDLIALYESNFTRAGAEVYDAL